eukprot:22968-Chlamydomonas_euryale.AAC.3
MRRRRRAAWRCGRRRRRQQRDRLNVLGIGGQSAARDQRGHKRGAAARAREALVRRPTAGVGARRPLIRGGLHQLTGCGPGCPEAAAAGAALPLHVAGSGETPPSAAAGCVRGGRPATRGAPPAGRHRHAAWPWARPTRCDTWMCGGEEVGGQLRLTFVIGAWLDLVRSLRLKAWVWLCWEEEEGRDEEGGCFACVRAWVWVCVCVGREEEKWGCSRRQLMTAL